MSFDRLAEDHADDPPQAVARDAPVDRELNEALGVITVFAQANADS